MVGSQPTDAMTESYARWRSSRLGQITDGLEQQLLFELIGSVASKTLLDVGCGDGALASELARRGAIVTGLDADPAMIAAARRRTKIEGTQLHLVEGQAERLPFNDLAQGISLCSKGYNIVEVKRSLTTLSTKTKCGHRSTSLRKPKF